MTRERGGGATLRARLLGAFALVAAIAIAAFAGLTLWAGRGDVNDLVHRQQQTTATSIAAAAADAYRAAGGWTAVDLRPVRALAVSADAIVEVRDGTGADMLVAGHGLGLGRMRGVTPSESAFGAARVVPVVAGGTTVGTVSIRFREDVLPPAERQLRDALTRTTLYGILIAALAALLAGFVVAEGITRPLRRLTEAVRRLGHGERGARANVRAPGELGELAAAFDTMADTLEREDALRRALTADVAHELRTPVTILAAQCEAMLDGVVEPSAEQIGSLHDEVLRLGRVIEDLETLAAAESAGLQLRRTDADLGAVVEETVRLLAPQFEVGEVAVGTSLEPVVVPGDALRLAQVVRNLLSNALKFTPAGGRVDVTLRRRDGRAELIVADDGVGIPAAELPHVFDRFWRGSSGRTTSGSGVGLAVVEQLVHAHGGEVTAASSGRGTVFTVRLPAA
jgi:two-component system sensor histidine kinase BaeS